MIVEDVDEIEARRIRNRGRRYSARDLVARGGPDDPRVYRRLAVYARPFRGSIVTALFMSGFAAAAKLGFVFILKRVLEPILEGHVQTPLEAAVRYGHAVLRAGHAGGAGGPAGGGWLDAAHAPFAIAQGALSVTWKGYAAPRQLLFAAIAMVALSLVEQANKYGQKLLMRSVAYDVVGHVRLALFDRLMTLSMRFFHANHSGKLMSRLTNDLNNLGILLVDVMVDMATDAFLLIGSLIYLWVQGGWLVIGGLAVLVVSFVPVQRISRRIRRREMSNQGRMGSLFMSLSETFGAQKVVKAFNAEGHERGRFSHANNAFTEGKKKAAELRARIEPAVEIVGVLGVSSLVWFGGMEVLRGHWGKTDLMAIIFLLVQAVAAMRRLGDTNSKMHAGLSSADRVATVLFSDPEFVDAPDAIELTGLQRDIRFDHVCYDHDPEHPVLRDISFTLPRGRTLALVGHTGSGKTTLADLVLRFYEVDEGAILIDGVDIRRFRMTSLRRQIALVTQDTQLFRDTVAANIAYGLKDTPQADIEDAARAANAHDFITRLPQGYQTEIGERGLKLSGGERQRIAIARALLKNAPILVLDEATSALDTASEAVVQQAINNLKAGRTTIVIAHRLSTIRDADRILVLERGRIAEQGTHDELVRLGGIYAGMINIQHRD